MRNMANIRQIAQIANVSVTTVSRVLNHHPYVSADKRAAVLEAIASLNYVPNLNAVHLVKGSTSTIAVILPYLDNPYLSSTVEGILEEAHQVGYHIMLCTTNYNEEQELKILEMLKTKQIDGVIITSRSSSWEQITSYLQYGPIIVCEDTESLPISCVFINHYRSIQLGMRYLMDKGHRQIGYCFGRHSSQTSELRRKAYNEALTSIEQPVQQEWLFHDSLSIESGISIAEQLIHMKQRPTALLVVSHQAATSIITTLKKHHLHIPEDFAILSFDDHPLGKLLDITSMELSNKEVGCAAFTMLYESISNKSYVPEKLELSYNLIERLTV